MNLYTFRATMGPCSGETTVFLRHLVPVILCDDCLVCTSTRRWLRLCTVWLSHSQVSSLSKAVVDLGKARSLREPNLGCRGADRPGWCDVLPKKPAWELYHEHVHCLYEADLLARSLWMRGSHSTQAQSMASHCRITSSTGKWLFTDGQ